jgi:CubicO group peptidase (beta-lactamase class C family)
MKKVILGVLLFFILVLFPASFLAQETQTEAPPSPQGPSDPTELEAFLDGIMAAHLETFHVAGATIAVVKDGRLFFAKGYGYADFKKKKPVLADRTLFRPGSVTKLLTWTAVMQLVEQGKIDLEADVNTYLKDFKIPATYPEPIKIKHLLSHTPGFEDLATGMAARTAKDLMPLGKFLATHMPARVRPPGELTSYSNYGTALAGYIVEVISGMPFEDYMEQNIFKPLGMQHSTFREPLPANLEGDMSIGYTFKNGLFKEEKFELINGMAPAGSLSSCATDMAKFMIAHLQNGQYGDARILKEETAKLMHSRLFSHDLRVSGNAHGFWEASFNRLHIIEHGGDTTFFHSELVLVPEKNLGWFVSYNSPNGGAREQLLEAFLNRYYPPMPPLAEVKLSPESSKNLGRFCGAYGVTRRGYTTYEKLGALLMVIKVSATKEGTLLVALPAGMGMRQYAEVEPLVFRQINGQDTLVFKADSQGRIVYGFTSQLPHMALVKLKWNQIPAFHYFLLAICVIFFLSAALGWPIGALARVVCRRKREGAPAPKAAKWLAGGMSGLFLVFILGMVAATSNIDDLMFGVPTLLKVSLIFPLAAALLGIFALIYVILAWGKKYWTGCKRLHYTLIIIAALAFLWFLNYWNLLGWRF